MTRNELDQALRPHQSTSQIIWIGLNASIPIYVVIAFIIGRGRQGLTPAITEEMLPTWVGGFALAALVAATTSLVLRTVLLGVRAHETIIKEVREKGLQLEQVKTLMQRAFTPHILSWALNEAVAIFGFVLALLSGRPFLSLPFAGAALVLNLLTFPRLRAWLESIGVAQYCS